MTLFTFKDLNRVSRSSLIVGFFLAFTCGVHSAIICDGDPVAASVQAKSPTFSVLNTNTEQLTFTLASIVGNDTHLGLGYKGTVQSGIDVQPLPASVLIRAGLASASVTVTPIANHPFSTKTLTATITNSDNVCVLIGTPQAVTVTLTGFDPPRLDAISLNRSNIVLSWNAPVTGYKLQSAAELAPGNWLTVTNGPAPVQGTNRLILNLSESATFYRLFKP